MEYAVLCVLHRVWILSCRLFGPQLKKIIYNMGCWKIDDSEVLLKVIVEKIEAFENRIREFVILLAGHQ